MNIARAHFAPDRSRAAVRSVRCILVLILLYSFSSLLVGEHNFWQWLVVARGSHSFCGPASSSLVPSVPHLQPFFTLLSGHKGQGLQPLEVAAIFVEHCKTRTLTLCQKLGH